jgi:hypothetical protein
MFFDDLSNETEFVALGSDAKFNESFTALLRPALPGAFHTYLQQGSVCRFYRTACNHHAGCQILVIVHPVGICFQIRHELFFLRILALRHRPAHRVYFPRQHPRFLTLKPVSGLNVDKNGKEFFTISAIALLAAKGAAIGAAGYTASVGFSQGGFNNWSWSAFAKAAGMGAVSGVVSGGIGHFMGGAGSLLNEVGCAGLHGLSNVGVNAAFGNGVSFSSFASGAAGSLVGSGITNQGWGDIAQIGGSSLVGGTTEALTGGDFWRGATSSATVGLLNHAAHDVHARMSAEVEDVKVRKAGAEYADRTAGRTARFLTLDEFKNLYQGKTYDELIKWEDFKPIFADGETFIVFPDGIKGYSNSYTELDMKHFFLWVKQDRFLQQVGN